MVLRKGLLLVLLWIGPNWTSVALRSPPGRSSPSTSPSQRRREFLQGVVPAWLLLGEAAHARGLVKFPCVEPLANQYHLMRAGTSLLEQELGILSTNPLFLTNRDDALSVTGQEQVVEACRLLKKNAPTLVKYSLAARCIDSSNIVGQELNLGRDRLVPEFTFMDPRGIGSFDMGNLQGTTAALYALDYDEAGRDGLGGRPPANEDGTPHETLADQAVRLRQVLSVLETQYTGETILMIFPDGTGPALLSAMICGLPYRNVHELEFLPGEVRLDVTRSSTLQLYQQLHEQQFDTFLKLVEQGRGELKVLKRGESVNLKDKRMEEDRILIEQAFQEKETMRKNVELQKQKERQVQQDELARQRAAKLEEKRAAEEEAKQQRLLRQQAATDGTTASIDTGMTFSVIGAAGIAAAVGVGMSSTGRSPATAKPPIGTLPTGAASLSGDLSDNNVLQETIPVVQTAIESATDVALLTDTPPKMVVSVGPDEAEQFKSEEYSKSKTEPPIVDKQAAADEAMKDYLDRDDGGDDWLLSLSEMIQDDDDDLRDKQQEMNSERKV